MWRPSVLSIVLVLVPVLSGCEGADGAREEQARGPDAGRDTDSPDVQREVDVTTGLNGPADATDDAADAADSTHDEADAADLVADTFEDTPDGSDPREDAPSDMPPGELDTVIDDAAVAVCDALYRCCSAADVETYFGPVVNHARLEGLGLRVPPSQQECRATLAQAFQVVPFGPWVEAARAGLATWDGAASAACLSELRGAGCGPEAQAALHDSTCWGFAPPIGQTRRMFSRTAGPDEPCLTLSDGVGGTFFGTCDPDIAFCCVTGDRGCRAGRPGSSGTCQRASDVGEPCTVSPVQVCRTGLDCGSDGRCERNGSGPLGLGDRCYEGLALQGECVDSWCDLFGSERCEPLLPDDADCRGGYECRSGFCDGTCQPWTFCAGPDEQPAVGAESCADALALAEVSTSIPTPADRYRYQLSGTWGDRDDYNPLQESGMAPGCSLVFDARGRDLVYALTLDPGQTLRVRLALEPSTAVPAVYLVEGCPVSSWPDTDGSGLCGDNEYATEGFCPVTCGPLEWSFTWPTTLNGQPTAPRQLYLVLDEVGDTSAASFTLDWALSP